MIRFLFFIVVCAGIYFLWSHIQQLIKQRTTPPPESVEPMVKCHYCQAYSPQTSSIKGTDGHWYCCLDHERQARK